MRSLKESAMNYERRLAAELARRRQKLGLSQVELHKRAGVSQNLISKLERAAQREPSFITLVKVGAALGLSPNELATLLGVWYPSGEEELPDPRIQQWQAAFRTLPPGAREELLRIIDRMIRGYLLDQQYRERTASSQLASLKAP